MQRRINGTQPKFDRLPGAANLGHTYTQLQCPMGELIFFVLREGNALPLGLLGAQFVDDRRPFAAAPSW
jgi:hypothetical protein